MKTTTPTANAQDVVNGLPKDATREAKDTWVMIPRKPTEAMRFAAASAETRLEIWPAMLSASPAPPTLSKDLRACVDQIQALIQEAKGLAGDGAVTDHLDFAEHWLGKIEDSQTQATVLVNALREAAHDLVSTASHHGSHAAIDQDKIDCLRDAVSDFDDVLNARDAA